MAHLQSLLIFNEVILIDLLYFHRSQTKFAKVMFSQVSVCPQGEYLVKYPLRQVHAPGRYIPLGRYTPGQVHPQAGTLPGRYPPRQVHPGSGTPPGQVLPKAGPPPPQQVHPSGAGTAPWAGTPLPGQVPPTVHAGIRSTSGRYASHWNAFLSWLKFYPRKTITIR